MLSFQIYTSSFSTSGYLPSDVNGTQRGGGGGEYVRVVAGISCGYGGILVDKWPMEKWEGKVSSTLTKANANQIWPFFIDFFNFHKWFPNLSTCYGVHGTNGQVGSTRYCAGFSIPNEDGGADQVSWSKERLVAVDHENMSMSYEMVDSNVGFKSYLSTIKVVGGYNSEGCVVEWSFVVNPIDGLTYEDLLKKYQIGLEQTTKKMEDALVHNNV